MENPVLYEGERLDEVNYRLRLIQKTNGLLFGTDALLLASYIKANPSARAVELGGGSGIISLLCLARQKLGYVTCIEVQPVYAELIARNIALNGFEGKMQALCANVRDVATVGIERAVADVVFANPPYMKNDAGAPNAKNEKNIARHEVEGDIEDFCAAAARLLRFGGHFYCVYRTDRMADLFAALDRNRLQAKRLTMVHADMASAPSMLLLDAVLGGKSGLRVTRPLLLYKSESDRAYTADVEQVMENGYLPHAAEN